MSCAGQSCSNCSGQPSEWNALSAPELDALAKGMRTRILQAGEALYLQGDPCEGIYCLERGLIGIRRLDHAGQSVLLRLAHGGDLLGYNALMREEEHLESAEVLAPSRVCFIGRWLISPMLRRNVNLSNAFLRRALTDLSRLEHDYSNLLTKTLKGRLLCFLMSFHRQAAPDQDQDVCSFELPLQRKELAALLGATPESVSRIIGRLNAEGAVEIKERHVEIRDLGRVLNGASDQE